MDLGWGGSLPRGGGECCNRMGVCGQFSTAILSSRSSFCLPPPLFLAALVKESQAKRIPSSQLGFHSGRFAPCQEWNIPNIYINI